jgi:hypothetical protein
LTPVGPVYEIVTDPAVGVLQTPASIHIRFGTETAAAAATATATTSLLIHRWDETTHRWAPLPTVVGSAQQLASAQTTHLGRFGLFWTEAESVLKLYLPLADR